MKPLLAGNWKMHADRAEAARLAEAVRKGVGALAAQAEVALFPPFTAIETVVRLLAGSELTVGAQNFHPEEKGAFTGEISAPMLLDCGVTRVLVGHSERRHLLGESDAFCNRKVLAALRHDILPVLCVGERLEERDSGATREVLARQVKAGLRDVPAPRAGELTIAYEPVWAIGSGRNATPAQAREAHGWIREILAGLFGDPARQIRILYGGSVKPSNAGELLREPGVAGVLVGGASLDAEAFCAIVRAACA
ncbi:MAG: triose-phosphate isomerase [Planctomycetaceae bacterium]